MRSGTEGSECPCPLPPRERAPFGGYDSSPKGYGSAALHAIGRWAIRIHRKANSVARGQGSSSAAHYFAAFVCIDLGCLPGDGVDGAFEDVAFTLAFAQNDASPPGTRRSGIDRSLGPLCMPVAGPRKPSDRRIV